MIVTPVKLAVMRPPKDDLLAHIRRSKLSLKEGDIVAITSKVVSIWEGRCVPKTEGVTKEDFVRREASWYFDARDKKVGGPHGRFFTITNRTLISMAGIDVSNGNEHFLLWPKDPMKSAQRLLSFLKKTYRRKKMGVIITDSRGVPLRRGAMGMAIAYAGFEPLYDYRGVPDIFGRTIKREQANIAEGLAAAAVLVMGEAAEQTPLAVIRNAPHMFAPRAGTRNVHNTFFIRPHEDVFAAFYYYGRPWKRGRVG